MIIPGTFLFSLVYGEEFSEEETRLILDSENPDELPPETADKCRRLYLLDDFDLIPRNLKVLLDKAAVSL